MLNTFSTESKLNKQNVTDACDPNKCDKSYINYLPFTAISKQAAQYENMLRSFSTAAPARPPTLYEIRRQIITSGQENEYRIRSPQFTKVTKHSYTPPANSNVYDPIVYYMVQYHGSHMRNGMIIACDGGGYALHSAQAQMHFAETISKLTGCVVIVLDYKQCPEYVLPYQTSELIELYKFAQTQYNVPSHRIAFVGDSAGGGLVLLALQSMKQNIELPACVWLNSPWTCLDMGGLASHANNTKIDAKFGNLDALKMFASYAIGEKDANGKNIVRDGDAVTHADNEIFSPVYGKFDGLPAMYFMVGATEVLLDDTLECARQAYEVGVEVKVDIHPYMQHVWCRRLHLFPEALVATIRGSEWILHQFHRNKRIKQSKL